jgi:hypothetical protein
MALSATQSLTLNVAIIALLGLCSVTYCAQNSQRFVYSMGLGKRYSPYSFGLGKRGDLYVPVKDVRGRHVFSFGLGKRDADVNADFEPFDQSDYQMDQEVMQEEKRGGGGRAYSFGLGKRPDSGKSFYSFGLGKRDITQEEARSPLVSLTNTHEAAKEKGKIFNFAFLFE